jgi:hypothetical protein
MICPWLDEPHGHAHAIACRSRIFVARGSASSTHLVGEVGVDRREREVLQQLAPAPIRTRSRATPGADLDSHAAETVLCCASATQAKNGGYGRLCLSWNIR